MSKSLPLVAALVAVIALTVMVGLGIADMPTVLLVIVLTLAVLPLSLRLLTERDPWLLWAIPMAYFGKLAAAGFRYWIVVGPYGGLGDSIRYHENGLALASVWESIRVPSMGDGSGAGTIFVDNLTGLFYAVHRPQVLGGFFTFATLAFIGQLFFYAAFRRSLPDARLGIYGALILFLPALVFWPSSIGKESLMIFFLGVATYALARSFKAYSLRWLLLAGAGLAGAGVIRPHVAVILSVSFAVASSLGRASWKGGIGFRRVLVLGVGVFLVVTSISALGERYDLESADDLDPFVSEVQRRTQTGGSQVEGGAIASPGDIPAATIRVLFRPLPHEAHNLQAMAAAVENAAILGLVLWRLPAMIRNIRLLRTPYVMMCAAFTVGFTLAFSTIFNLGILTRQRAQVLPYMLAVVVALGWAGRRPIDLLEPPQPAMVGATGD